MKVLKLILGILCICLAAIVIFQSCAAGLVDAFDGNEGMSGFSGMIVSVLMIAGGIIMIAARNSLKNGASIAGAIVFLVAALIGFSGAGFFADLKIWSGFCVINAVVNVISVFTNNKARRDY